MPAATVAEERKAPTFEEVWALFKEVGERQKETAVQMRETDRRMEETDRQMKETDRRMEETDRRMEETAVQMRETDRRMEETDRQIQETAAQMKETDRRMNELWKKTNKTLGDLGLRLGEIVERLIAPNLVEKFNALNFDFRISSPNRKYYDRNHQELTEVDVQLENSSIVMAVEAKSKLLVSHVQDHIERMNILRAYADEHDDRRVWIGAVAGAVLAPDARKAALKAGFYLIEQSGDTMMISVPEGFKPKEWTFRMTPQTHTSQKAE